MPEKKFEEAMLKLEKIVERLEGGDLALEESLKAFEEGMQLIGFCSKKLEEVEQKVTVLMKESAEKFGERPFEMADQGERA